jgi:predicted transcriptional regulator
MPREIINLTAQIVISHASMTELTPKELVAEIKTIHDVLVSLESEVVVPEPEPIVTRQRKPRKVKMKESPEAKAVENEEGLPVGDPDDRSLWKSERGKQTK